MIRKGINLRRSRTLGYDMGDGTITTEDGDVVGNNYVVIYRYQGIEDWQKDRVQVRKGFVLDEKQTKSSRDRGDKVTWYRKLAKMTGHSRTNMVYGEVFKQEVFGDCGLYGVHKFVKVYWVEGGRVYVGRSHRGDCPCKG